MIISNRSGKGLDGLQGYCTEIVKGELDYSPQVHKQLIGRLRRPGMVDPVTAHYLHVRSEEHTSELQSLMRISYAVFCLKKKKHYLRLNNFPSPSPNTQLTNYFSIS